MRTCSSVEGGLERLHLEVRRAHPRLDRAEGMLDGLAPQWDLAGIIVEPLLNALKYAFVPSIATMLATPVARHSASRVEPLRFYGAVERGIARRIGADRHYVGLVTKNPVRAEWRREEAYTLGEPADWLFDTDMRPDPTVATTLGAGRNRTVFDELRAIAYREVREFKAAAKSLDEFYARLERVALGINLRFPQALKLSEVRAISKSVAKWTWRHFCGEKFFSRQSFLGKRANAKRWAGHVSAESTKPWLTETFRVAHGIADGRPRDHRGCIDDPDPCPRCEAFGARDIINRHPRRHSHRHSQQGTHRRRASGALSRQEPGALPPAPLRSDAPESRQQGRSTPIAARTYLRAPELERRWR